MRGQATRGKPAKLLIHSLMTALKRKVEKANSPSKKCNATPNPKKIWGTKNIFPKSIKGKNVSKSRGKVTLMIDQLFKSFKLPNKTTLYPFLLLHFVINQNPSKWVSHYHLLPLLVLFSCENLNFYFLFILLLVNGLFVSMCI